MTQPETGTSTGRCPIDFDQYAPDFPERSTEIFRELQATCPVGRSERYGGFTLLTRYDDIAEAARDDVTFSSLHDPTSPFRGITIPPHQTRFGFIEMDPPDSVEHRRAVAPLLSPRAVAGMEAGMRELVDDAIDEFIEDGKTDFATEVADRIPAVTTLRVLGLPLDAWRRWVDYFHHKVSDKLESSTSTAYAANNSVIQEMTDHVRDRRENPRDDGLSQMVNTPVRGELVSIEQAVENLSLVLLGGLDTTAALLTNTALYLAENPADRERLRADRSLMTSACEEFLRFFSPVQNLARTVRHATTFKGVPLDRNERVLLSWAAANRDPSQFEDPDTVKLDRFPNRHQAFGLGVHRCAGSHLARAEWRLVFEAMLDRLPDWSIDRERAVPYKQIASDNGWHEMPMTFTPGTRVRSAREEAR